MSAKQPCGTVAAYRRHRRNGQPPCSACLAANAAYVRADRRNARVNSDLRQVIHILATAMGCGRTS